MTPTRSIGTYTSLTVFMLLSLSCGGQDLPVFDQQNAFNYLKKQCEFGPRDPGSDGHQKCLEFLADELRQFAENVSLQQFQYTFGPDRRTATMTNIIANFAVDKSERILLCAHWDTRPWADQDPNPENHNAAILGANDGASGVAVLLEIARILGTTEPKYGVDIIFFDAEDCGGYGDDASWAAGSKQFAKNKNPAYWPTYGILLDFVGDADLQIYVERNSLDYAPDVVKKVWDRAARLGIDEFINASRYRVTDDHLSLLDVGIACIDLIDFDYPYYHTLQDTPDKCSAESLGKVGRVVLSLLYE